ncbi:MAG: hypothetical protein K6E52_01495 [Bacteroidaceae bacterium]|nr:hypothetical protein [Bacteroidaceae bacterium]
MDKDTTTYVSRPKGKPDMTTKGKMNEWANGYKEFIPQGQKASNRTVLKQLGNSRFYKSEGTKESSYSLHLNVDGKSEDPVAEMYEQFKLLTADEQKQMPQLPEGEGRMLFEDNKGLKIWLDNERHEVCILTRLQCGSQIERELLQAQAAMNVALARNRQQIITNSNQ